MKTWNQRYRESITICQSNDRDQISKLLVELEVLKEAKELSFGERKMIEHCRSILSGEAERNNNVVKVNFGGLK
jgi:CarD family transcriptional regulator